MCNRFYRVYLYSVSTLVWLRLVLRVVERLPGEATQERFPKCHVRRLLDDRKDAIARHVNQMNTKWTHSKTIILLSWFWLFLKPGYPPLMPGSLCSLLFLPLLFSCLYSRDNLHIEGNNLNLLNDWPGQHQQRRRMASRRRNARSASTMLRMWKLFKLSLFCKEKLKTYLH